MAKRRSNGRGASLPRDAKGRFVSRKKTGAASKGRRRPGGLGESDRGEIRPGRPRRKPRRYGGGLDAFSPPTPYRLPPKPPKRLPRPKAPKRAPLRDASGRFTSAAKIQASEAAKKRHEREREAREAAERRKEAARKGWETRRRRAEEKAAAEVQAKRDRLKRAAPCDKDDLTEIEDKFTSPPWPNASGWFVFRADGTAEGYLERWLGDETPANVVIDIQNWIARPLYKRPDLWVSAGVLFIYRGEKQDQYDKFKGQSAIWKYSRPARFVNAVLQGARAVADRLEDSGAVVLAIVVGVFCGFRPED